MATKKHTKSWNCRRSYYVMYKLELFKRMDVIENFRKMSSKDKLQLLAKSRDKFTQAISTAKLQNQNKVSDEEDDDSDDDTDDDSDDDKWKEEAEVVEKKKIIEICDFKKAQTPPAVCERVYFNRRRSPSRERFREFCRFAESSENPLGSTLGQSSGETPKNHVENQNKVSDEEDDDSDDDTDDNTDDDSDDDKWKEEAEVVEKKKIIEICDFKKAKTPPAEREKVYFDRRSPSRGMFCKFDRFPESSENPLGSTLGQSSGETPKNHVECDFKKAQTPPAEHEKVYFDRRSPSRGMFRKFDRFPESLENPLGSTLGQSSGETPKNHVENLNKVSDEENDGHGDDEEEEKKQEAELVEKKKKIEIMNARLNELSQEKKKMDKTLEELKAENVKVTKQMECYKFQLDKNNTIIAELENKVKCGVEKAQTPSAECEKVDSSNMRGPCSCGLFPLFDRLPVSSAKPLDTTILGQSS